uniref:Uncharacterized protein n=1 Tax=Oryza glumipatula TaxID=40148 RepID=A0A0E0AWZ8_9ORYZ
MGISSMPAPKDSVVAYLLYNTAVSIAILADMVRAALVFLGLPWLDYDHATCPLCRHRLLPATTESPSPSPATATPHFARI